MNLDIYFLTKNKNIKIINSDNFLSKQEIKYKWYDF